MPFLSYWFWPNPAGWYYTDQRVQMLFAFCAALIVISFLIRFWRGRLTNAVTKNLSRTWSATVFWFGIVGLILTVSRVETIQFVSMRALWALWVLLLAVIIFFQFIQFRRRHYTVIERAQVVDERDRYLPRKKK